MPLALEQLLRECPALLAEVEDEGHQFTPSEQKINEFIARIEALLDAALRAVGSHAPPREIPPPPVEETNLVQIAALQRLLAKFTRLSALLKNSPAQAA